MATLGVEGPNALRTPSPSTRSIQRSIGRGRGVRNRSYSRSLRTISSPTLNIRRIAAYESGSKLRSCNGVSIAFIRLADAFDP